MSEWLAQASTCIFAKQRIKKKKVLSLIASCIRIFSSSYVHTHTHTQYTCAFSEYMEKMVSVRQRKKAIPAAVAL